ncbi:DUF4364 family protein [Alkaliphilus oremlandii]|uniref:DUF4364 family protein n=1 Tax=Alkaliphilus oremlandii (strain OhILAs) TaxID=350688 RepID=A8MID1_ALKOO|nr:DUF4364 family protein [Alkaliphilus oremlandii]ABW19563.1 conserved hypothetical protein [Alkaliphilus oremlandii OhILAs]
MFTNNSQQLAENKLLLLYILDRIEFPMTNAQVTQFVLENDIMNYFMLQQYLGELKDSKFIVEKQSEKHHIFILTESGKNTLSYFVNRIPKSQVERIDQLLNIQKEKMVKNRQVKADYIKISDDEYLVKLDVIEKDMSLIHLNLSVANNKQAKQICEKWREDAPNLYSQIINLLIE